MIVTVKSKMPMKKKISICIPTLNEEANICNAVNVVENLFSNELLEYELEIIVTDNASSDQTWKLVKDMSETRPFLRGFRFSRNFGYQNSVFAGLSLAKGDAVIAIDADLEDPPDVVPEFVKEWEQGNDVVYGVRRNRYSPFFLKFLIFTFYHLLFKLSPIKVPKNSGDFRLLDRKVLNILKSLPERNLYLRGLISYIGFKQKAVFYDRQPRMYGKSKFRLGHYIIFAIDAFTALTKVPLRAIGIIGAILFSFSILTALFYIIGKLLGTHEVKGFTTIVVLMLMMNGMNFMFIGIIGEYLSRIFDDSKSRPRVIISETVNEENPPVMF